ncbi:RICIN domain-containing protein, partial [Streptomyces sp. NPDC093094]|uniref:RICIN domain-containing protein n=1 Tax=Streptomyces sp. NPDC093094 TaxID=3366026 RepID=UPI0038293E92
TTAQLKRVLGRTCHDSILSNDRVPTEPGTVHFVSAGTAQAADGTLNPDTQGPYTLAARWDRRADVSAGIAANRSVMRVNLRNLAGTGTLGRSGLCYPEPFNPGVAAYGYCWNNEQDDKGSLDWWTPQGISVPHSSDENADGWWPVDQQGVSPRRWEVVSMHKQGPVKFRFVDLGANGLADPRYFDVQMVTIDPMGTITPVDGHADSVVWFGDNLLVGTGRALEVFSLDNLLSSPSGLVIPRSMEYRTSDGNFSCKEIVGTSPCLNGMSFDRKNSALLTNEFSKVSGARVVRWPFDTKTWLPRSATGVEFGNAISTGSWSVSPLRPQGVLFTEGTIFLSAACPAGYDNGYVEASCVYKAMSGSTFEVLTSVPDMTQNLDWDYSVKRIRGVNEVIRPRTGFSHHERLVFGFKPEATQVDTFTLKNVHSGKCLIPYSAGLNNDATIMQLDCTGENAQDWYWDSNGTQIKNFQSKRCLSVRDASTSNNAILIQYDCRSHATQQWEKVAGSAGGIMLRNRGSGLCATIVDGSVGNAHAVQWPCNPAGTSHAWIGTK